MVQRVKLTDRKIQALDPEDGEVFDVVVDRLFAKGDGSVPTVGFHGYARFSPGKGPTRRQVGVYVPPPDVDPEKQPSDDELLELWHLTLAQARRKLVLWLDMAARGIDPKDDLARRREDRRKAAEAESERRGNTIERVVADFAAERLSKQRRGREAERDLRSVFVAAWPGCAITDITELDVLKIINAKKVATPAFARLLLNHIKQLFRFAVGAKVYGITVNPCAGLIPKDIIGKRRKRTRVLTNDELRALWTAIAGMIYPVRPVYELLMLTSLRLTCVTEAVWSEFPSAVVRALRNRKPGEAIDWDHVSNEPLLWVIPAARMKGEDGEAQDFAVPLTPEILQVLEGLPQFSGGGEFLFSLNHGRGRAVIGTEVKRKVDAAMLGALREMALERGDDPDRVTLPHWVNHDIRRTCRTNFSRMRIAQEVSEALLAHKRTGIEGVYDHHDFADEKREALELWHARLRSIVGRKQRSEDVTPIAAE